MILPPGRSSGSFIIRIMWSGGRHGTGAITRYTGVPGGLTTGTTITGITITGTRITMPITATGTITAAGIIKIITTRAYVPTPRQ